MEVFYERPIAKPAVVYFHFAPYPLPTQMHTRIEFDKSCYLLFSNCELSILKMRTYMPMDMVQKAKSMSFHERLM